MHVCGAVYCVLLLAYLSLSLLKCCTMTLAVMTGSALTRSGSLSRTALRSCCTMLLCPAAVASAIAEQMKSNSEESSVALTVCDCAAASSPAM